MKSLERSERPSRPESLSGIIERVAFHNQENGFCVLRGRVEGQASVATIVGRIPSVSAGENFEAMGAWFTDREHGRQFRAEELRVSPPCTAAGIEKYLGSGMIKGVGPHFAARLVAAFGNEVFDVIERAPKRLLEVRGIGRERQKRILQAWDSQKAVRDIMVFLHSHGVGTARAVRIYKTYGQDAIAIVRENPYRLSTDIHGIGFKVADQIARHLGIEPQAKIRAEAGIHFVLESLSREGHCAFPRDELLAKAGELLGIATSILVTALEGQLQQRFLSEAPIDGTRCIYLTQLYHAESQLAKTLIQLSRATSAMPSIDADKAVPWVEKRVGLALAPSQREAVRQALASKVLVITGGPGVGKTTLVNSILQILLAKRLECMLCAPTGRAARRLTESTGMQARTIHRLLEFNPATRRFRFDHDHLLKCDALVVDEVSMADIVLMHHLVRALPARTVLILVGDVDQLPSVGPGQVLRDLLESGVLPVVRLTEVFRQAALSRIVTNAHRINQGLDPELSSPEDGLSDFFFIEAEHENDVVEKTRTVVTERIPRRFGLDPMRDVQVLVPMNRSPLGATALNVHLQAALNREGLPAARRFAFDFRLGDKVMQIVNNYDKEVFNGDVGFITRVNADDQELFIDFYGRELLYDFGELDEIVPAYACTIHKSQGSEYPAVVLILHTQHFILLRRALLYTAVTRAKKLVVIVGSRKALSLALRANDDARRISGLRGQLMELAAKS